MAQPQSKENSQQPDECDERLGESSGEAVFRVTVDSTGNVLELAGAAADLFTPQENQTSIPNLFELVHPDDRSLAVEFVERVMRDRSSVPFGELRFSRASGDFKSYRVVFVGDASDRESANFVLAAFDISERVRRENQLRQTEVRFHDMLEYANDLIYTTDLEGNFVSLNSACERLTGYRLGEGVKLNIADVIVPESLDFVRSTVAKKLAGETNEIYETEIITKSGGRLAVEISSHLLFDNGRPVGLQGIARDITERKQTQRELQLSNERFAKAFLAGPVAMVVTRLRDGMILDANESALRFYGYERTDYVGHSMLELKIWPSVEVRSQTIELLLRDGSLREHSVMLLNKNGEPRNMILSAELITLGEETCSLWVSQDVTDRHQAEQALQWNRERYRLATQAGRSGVWDVILSAQSIYVDPTLIAMLGYEGTDGIDRTGFWSNVVHPDDLPQVVAAVMANLQAKAPSFEFEHRARRASGDWLWFHTRGYVIRDDNGGPVRLLGTATDITERRSAQEALRQSEERYRTFIGNTMDAVWRFELDQPIATDLSIDEQSEQFYHRAVMAECNDALAQMYGFASAQEMIGTRLEDFWSTPDPAKRENFRNFARSGYRLTEAETVELDRHGQPKVFVNNLVGIVENGQLLRVWGTQRDVTRRKQAEALLNGQQHILELIATGAPLDDVLTQILMFVEGQRPGLRGSVLILNPEGDRLTLGVAPSLPAAFNQAVDGLLVGPTAGACGTAVHRRDVVIIEDVLTDPLTAEWTWIVDEFNLRSLWSSPIYSANGSILGTFALYREVPATPDTFERELVAVATHLASLAIDHTYAERALRVSEQRFSKAFSASPNAMSIISAREGIFMNVNDAFLEICGYDRDELIGRSVNELGLVVNSSDYDSVVGDLNDRIPVRNREFTGRNKAGELRAQMLSMEAVELNSEKCFLCAVTDITERQRAEAALRDSEERLRQSQKMEAVGRLAGGIAHDFNNILTGIIGYSDMSLIKMDRENPLRRNLEQIRQAADRAANLTHQLLAYSRRQILQPTLLDVNSIVLEMDQMLRRLIGEDIVLRTELGPIAGHIKADRGQLEQVLMNLAVNARDAMPKGGTLTLSTSAIDLTAPQPVDEFKLRPGHWLHLAVRDTGMGMSAEVKAQIFEPFFTTKEVGKGTGLGLATVFGIVKQSGGYVNVESEPGVGSCFDIYLPRVVETPVEIHLSAEPEVPRGAETILLIEDDPTVRGLAREILEMSGYRVIEAQSGDEALEIGAGDESIQLLLTDVVMPNYSGRELADRITTLRPDLKVLYMSGYTEDAIVHHGVLEDGLEFIQKPFSPDALARRVRVVLDR